MNTSNIKLSNIHIVVDDLQSTTERIEDELDAMSSAMAKFNKYRLANGLLPDEFKTDEYRQVKAAYDAKFKQLQETNKAKMRKRKAEGTKHYVEVHGVKISRMAEIQLSKWVANEGIAFNTMQPEERTALIVKFMNEKFPGQLKK